MSQINTSTPEQPRFVAEWEPAKGSIIRYPLGLPGSLPIDLSNNGLLYVVVSSSLQANLKIRALSANGINMTNVRYIITNNDSIG